MILKCECGGNVSTEAKQCPHCGKPGPFALPQKKPDHTSAWLVSIVVAVGGLLLLYLLMN
jgi:hypothetical protein